MRRNFYVTYQNGNGVYCSSIVYANGRETVETYYEGKGYAIIDIHPATLSEVSEGKRKHMPFIDL